MDSDYVNYFTQESEDNWMNEYLMYLLTIIELFYGFIFTLAYFI